MECPACQRSNRPDGRFCLACGAALVRSCGACGRELPGDASFCDGCGASLASAGNGHGNGGWARRDPRAYTPRHLAERILTSHSALEGERKQVTVLFADVKGSLELAEGIDPERWHAILDGFFRLLADGVHRFEGTINQFTGDGVMALFGAPIAHEDHAQRACWAALSLKRELRRFGDELRMREGLNFSVRMGLNSGEVVVGSIGDDLRMDYTAQGQTVGLAARMEQLAEPGRIYLTDRTASLVQGYFTLEELGELEVRGVREPVRTYELREVGPLRSRLDVSRARGFSSFVGRRDEIAALEAALEAAVAGRGGVAGVVAEAGVGKSRLCWELCEHARARGLEVRSTQGVAHGRMIPFLPVLELLRGVLEVEERDSPQTARSKIAGFVRLLDRSLEASLPLLFDFLGVADPEAPAPPLTPDARQQRLFDLVAHLLRALASRRPVVLQVEDLHWLDPGSEALLARAIEATADARILWLVNQRPEYTGPWAAGATRIALDPLGAEETSELLRDLLGEDASMAALAREIGARTQGNPFFIEELVQSLAESGVLAGERGAYHLAHGPGHAPSQLALPASVQAVLAARIDRLGDRTKRVLQTAAVIGRRFGAELLTRVTGRPESEVREALGALVETGFVFEESLYPQPFYKFRHSLTREVASGSLLADARRRLHGTVAEALETLEAERLDERAGLLAHHWEAAGERWRAASWYRRAAEASGAIAAQESFAHWLKVREQLQGLDPSPEVDALGANALAQLLAAGGRVGAPPEQISALFREGRELASRSDSDEALARIFAAYGIYLFSSTGERAEADRLLAEAVRLADLTADDGLRVVCRFYHHVELTYDDLTRALEINAEGLALCGEDDGLGAAFLGYSPRNALLCARGPLLCRVGRPGECAAILDRARDFAREHRDPLQEALAEQMGSELAWTRGEVETAVSAGRRSVELAERTENASLRVLCYQGLGRALLLAQRFEEALAASTHALELRRRHRTYGQWEGGILASRACAQLAMGRRDDALHDAAEAVRRGAEAGAFAEAEARLASACVSLEAEGAGALPRVEAELERAAALFDRSGARGREAWVAEARAALATRLGDDTAPKAQLERALHLHREGGSPLHAERIAREAELRSYFRSGP